MEQIEARAIDLAGLRVGAILNKSSGGCDAQCESKLASILRDAGIMPLGINLVEGKDVEEVLDKLFSQKIDVLIVLGGDGTIRTAAERCGKSQTKLIPLPGGTMNMLPRALYGEGTWDEVLTRTLACPSQLEVGGGEVEGRQFFCAGIFGSPTLWADAREAARKSRWREAFGSALRAYHRTFSSKIYYRVEGGNKSATALSTICPLVSAAVKADVGTFEVVILDPHDVGDAVQLAWSALFSNWRRDETVASVKTDRVDLHSGGAIPALLDGEKVTLPRDTKVRYLRRCFTALVPLKA